MRILVVKLSSLGDLFHALPAVHALKTGLAATVDWVVQPEYESLVRCFTDVEGVIPFPRRAFWSGMGGFRRRLREHDYDLVVDLHGFLKSAIVTCLARGRRKVGPSFHREGSRLLYREVARRGGAARRHAVDRCLDTARHLGLAVGEPGFPVAFPARSLSVPRPRVGVVPLSRWPTKNWPLQRFGEVARGLQASRGASIVLFGGPSEAAACASIAAGLTGPWLNLAGKTSLPEMGGAFRELDLLIANDSGPAHMAAALGVPVLSIFGPTDPVLTGPFGPRHRAITADEPCRPCFSRRCAREGLQCLDAVTAARVLTAALEMLPPA